MANKLLIGIIPNRKLPFQRTISPKKQLRFEPGVVQECDVKDVENLKELGQVICVYREVGEGLYKADEEQTIKLVEERELRAKAKEMQARAAKVDDEQKQEEESKSDS